MKQILLSLLAVFLMTPSHLALAAETTIGDMATIVMQLSHYTTALEKKLLAEILSNSNSTPGEKVLAAALMRMQHSVGSWDENKLRSLSVDVAAPKPERKLAEILIGITHKPSDSDKQRLKMLAE